MLTKTPVEMIEIVSESSKTVKIDLIALHAASFAIDLYETKMNNATSFDEYRFWLQKLNEAKREFKEFVRR